MTCEQNSLQNLASEISEIPTSSSQGKSEDPSVFGFDDQPSRSIQTPAEVAEALSQAVDELDISDGQGWADHAAIDFSQNDTQLSRQDRTLRESSKVHDDIPKCHRSQVTEKSCHDKTLMGNSQGHDETTKSQDSRSSQSQGSFICDKCQKTCRSKAGLNSHSRVHK